MRGFSTASTVIAGVLLYGMVGAAAFAMGFGLSVRSARMTEQTQPAQSDSLAPCCAEAPLPDSAASGSAQRSSGRLPAAMIEGFDISARPRPAALRFGIVELLPDGLIEPATDESASLRASLEAATSAAIAPSTALADPDSDP